MENFFYDSKFFRDLEELMEYHDIATEADIYGLPVDWHIEAEEGSMQKIFTLKKSFIVDAVVNKTDAYGDRFPEESDSVFKQIEIAIEQAIDIDKLNEMLPELYYPSGKFFIINRNHLFDFIK